MNNCLQEGVTEFPHHVETVLDIVGLILTNSVFYKQVATKFESLVSTHNLLHVLGC